MSGKLPEVENLHDRRYTANNTACLIDLRLPISTNQRGIVTATRHQTGADVRQALCLQADKTISMPDIYYSWIAHQLQSGTTS